MKNHESNSHQLTSSLKPFYTSIIMKKSIFLLVFVSFLGMQCSNQKTEETQELPESYLVSLTPEQAKNTGIETELAEVRALGETLEVMGTIDLPPAHKLSMSVPIGGIVSEMDLLPGMKIKKGEVLLTLSDIKYLELKQNYLITQLQYNQLKTEFERAKSLKEQQATSEKQFKEIESNFNQSEIKMLSLESQLAMLGIKAKKLSPKDINPNITVFAPVDGYISKVFISKGEYVNPDRPMLELIDPSDIHIAMDILESDLGKLEENLLLDAKAQAFPDKNYTGHILLIGKVLDEQRMVEIHAHFDKEHPELLAGMYMNVTIHTKTKQALTVSDKAILQFGATNYIFIEKGINEYEALEIKTGISDNGFTEIKTKIPQNAKVVKNGAYTLLMKWKNAAEEE